MNKYFQAPISAVISVGNTVVDGVRAVDHKLVDPVQDKVVKAHRDRKALRRVKGQFREQMLVAGHVILAQEEQEEAARKALEDEVARVNREAAALEGLEITPEEITALIGANGAAN